MNWDRNYQVIVGVPSESIDGVQTFAMHLVRGLRDRNIDAHILVTGYDQIPSTSLPFPSDVPVTALPVRNWVSWAQRWRALIRYLENRAPCVYMPNNDPEHIGVTAQLSSKVRIVGVVHNDNPGAYEPLSRLGGYWDATVGVSPTIASRIASVAPSLADRLEMIPYGVPIPESLPERAFDPELPLRVTYAGRLEHIQKRILDLAKVIALAHERGVPARFTIIGEGRAEAALRRRCARLIEQGIVEFRGALPVSEVLNVYEQTDVFVLTSEYEGLPLSLLEAMGRGCIPVVTDIQSGVPELVKNGVTGYRVPVGAVDQIVERLAHLQKDTQLRRQISENAYQAIRDGGYTRQDMVERYVKLFQHVLNQPPPNESIRPHKGIVWPVRLRWRFWVPVPVWSTMRSVLRHRRGAANARGLRRKTGR